MGNIFEHVAQLANTVPVHQVLHIIIIIIIKSKIVCPGWLRWGLGYIFPLIQYDVIGLVLPTCITLHLLTLKFICYLSAQSIIASKSFCNSLLHTVLDASKYLGIISKLKHLTTHIFL